MNCLILDDVQSDSKIINRYCQRCDLFDEVHTFDIPGKAIKFIKENPVDVIFLDINMPDISGFQLLSSLSNQGKPAVIFMTSDDSHAPKAFDFNAIDFLLKPVSFNRFMKGMEKMAQLKTTSKGAQEYEKNAHIFLKVGSSYVNLAFDDLIYIQAMGDYVKFITADSDLLVHSTLKNIQNQLPEARFIRVHRSYIVNSDHFSEIKDNKMRIKDELIPVSNTHKNKVLSLLQTK